LIRFKLSKECGIDAASIAEGMQLDETAVGPMAIEWSSRLALNRAAEECEVAGEW